MPAPSATFGVGSEIPRWVDGRLFTPVGFRVLSTQRRSLGLTLFGRLSIKFPASRIQASGVYQPSPT